MSNPKEIITDSCVVFAFFKYFEMIEEYKVRTGKNITVDKVKKQQQSIYNKISTSLLEEMGVSDEEFSSLEEQHAFIKANYEKYITDKHFIQEINSIEKIKKAIEKAEEGRIFIKIDKMKDSYEKDPAQAVVDKNGNITGYYILHEKGAANTLRQQRELLKQKEAIKAKYEALEQAYKDLRQIKSLIQVGPLLEQIVNGEVKPYLIPPVIAEIKNHMTPRPEVGGWQSFDQNLVLSVIKEHFSIIEIHSEKIIKRAEKLAKSFRTAEFGETTTPMANDINSVGRFGDSLIMAYSVLLGLNLATLNVKDFIADSDKTVPNEEIRKHIAAIAIRKGYNPPALAYSPTEITNNEEKETTKNFRDVKIISDEKTIKSKFSSSTTLESY